MVGVLGLGLVFPGWPFWVRGSVFGFFVVACLGGVVSSLAGLFGGRGMRIFILEQGVFELGYFLVFGC